MAAYIIRRVWQMIPTMLGVVLLVFILFNTVGGDPAYVLAGKISSQEQIDNIRRQIGVDQPYYIQLGIFIKQIVTADFGASWSTNEAVSHIMATRLGPSLTVTSQDHEGGGYLRVYQVKGNEWVPVSGWIRGYREEVMALVRKANKK